MPNEIVASLLGALFGAISSFFILQFQEKRQIRSSKAALFQIFKELLERDIKFMNTTSNRHFHIYEYLDTSLWRYHHLKLIEVAPSVALYIDRYYLEVESQLAVFVANRNSSLPIAPRLNIDTLKELALNALNVVNSSK